jgi:hypothetical protein
MEDLQAQCGQFKVAKSVTARYAASMSEPTLRILAIAKGETECMARASVPYIFCTNGTAFQSQYWRAYRRLLAEGG